MQASLWGYEIDVDERYVVEPTAEIRRQIEAYERGERRAFDLTVEFPDDFTGAVMAAMTQIPYGETRTYGELAAVVDSSPVAVGQGCGRNPVPIVVPCHRVVGADSLGGFSAAGGTELKRRLLEHERDAARPTQASILAYGGGERESGEEFD